ncbi:hypothetical protein, partial [Bacteroides xylanisolvens]|uniref:hypothetical protein n=1 Tax=Bacteroides xylanisolvens TaxID=371601 RepID=UPI0022E7C54A
CKNKNFNAIPQGFRLSRVLRVLCGELKLYTKKNEPILFIEPLATASEKPKGFSIVPQIS